MKSLGRASRIVALVCSLFGAAAAERATAGGGPENVAVVVNGESWASKAVANEFVRLRRVPSGNVVYLTDLPAFETVDVDTFRRRILRPVLEAIEERGLKAQIDYVVYSSDLPYAIDARADFAGKTVPRAFTPIGSINGLTYLYQRTLAGGAAYLQLNSNRYMRRPLVERAGRPVAVGDRERFIQAMKLVRGQKWGEAEKLLRDLANDYPGQASLHYNLACCLARQERLPAAIAALSKAVEAGWSDRQHAENDADLKPLADRDDFQKLLGQMDKNSRATFDVQPTRAFRNRHRWNVRGEQVTSGGEQYLLSTMLAVTSGRGTSVAEAVAALRRSAGADGSRPAGTIYFMVNGNVRSKTRQRAFLSAAAQLKRAGVKAEVADGILPRDKHDVLGAMIGTASFDWKKSGSRILPGAICEHLTSFGGVMREKAGQTPLTEFIRHGAAGASGTVTEPLAIAAKFPFAFLHVHYARGCSLAEAFYQSVSGPYQLLIVGDPLCQPWVKRWKVSAAGLAADKEISGVVTIAPAVNGGVEFQESIGQFELYVDGRLLQACGPAEQFTLDSRKLADGYHEFRVIALDAAPVESQSRLVMPLLVNNSGRRVTLSALAETTVHWDQPVRVEAAATGADSIDIIHNGRRLASIAGEKGRVNVSPLDLGPGPVAIHAEARFGDARVQSAPVELTIVSPKSLPALPKPDNLAPGMLLKRGALEAVVIEQTTKKSWLGDQGL